MGIFLIQLRKIYKSILLGLFLKEVETFRLEIITKSKKAFTDGPYV